MNYAGQDKKFKIISTQQDFQLTEDPFEIVIKNQFGRIRQIVKKQNCFWDDDGNFYFVVENINEGIYYACFMGAYEDDDYAKQQRVFTDVQELFRCGVRGCPCSDANFVASTSCKCNHVIRYEEVFDVSIDGEDYLADKDGRYIYTSDGLRISFKSKKAEHIETMGKIRLDTMTGEEFKQLIEGRSQDGTINTVPELMDAMTGISDEETVKQDVNEQIDDKHANSSDIDEIL